MTVRHVRPCLPCNVWRYAGCSTVCRIPADTDPDSWEPNPQNDTTEGVA